MIPDGFLDLPARVFADDPGWIPENPVAVEAAFAPTNPWFEQGEAELFCLPGSSRAAAFFQPAMRVDGRPVAFFGYWCTAEDGGDAAVFEQVESWARARGAEALYGPIDFTTYGNYRIRLSVEADDAPTFPDEPHNPESWGKVLEDHGFELEQAYLTQLGAREMVAMMAQFKRPVIDALHANGYRIETFTHDDWLSRLPELHRIIDAIFGNNFAYSPLTWETFAAKCGEGFIRRTDPTSSVACYAPDGSLAGFTLIYPHYGAIVRQGAGADRVEATDLDFATHWPLVKDQPGLGAIGKTVGVSPDHRGHGMMAAMAIGTFERGGDRYPLWYGAMIRKGNLSARFGEGRTVGERWYGLYRKQLPT